MAIGRLEQRYFLEQRDKLEKDEALTPEMIAAVNGERSMGDTFAREFALDLMAPDTYRDEPDKTPRVFLLRDGKVSTLSESGVKPGSAEFWEAAMKGQLFGYKLGEKDPVQIQAWMGTAGIACAIGRPLELGKEGKFPDKPEQVEFAAPPKMPEKPAPPEPPRPVREPGQEPPRANFFTRLGAFFGNKASRDKIAMHTAWVDQTAAYSKFKNEEKEYQNQLEEYQEELERYARKVVNYHTALSAKRVRDIGKAGLVETYQRESAAWEKELANKDTLSKKREESARAIAAALGNTRGPDVLEAEKKELEARTAAYSAISDGRHVQMGLENMMSMFGPKPYAKENFVRAMTYKAADIQQLTPVDLTGLTVGEGKQITDEEFAALAMFAVLKPENGEKMARESNPSIIDYPGAVRAFEKAGYTRQETDELMMNLYASVVTTDAFRNDNPRNPMTTYFKDYLQPARLDAKQALEEYAKGNRQPLAEIVSRGMEFADLTARNSPDMDECCCGVLRMASRMADLMGRDPKLRELAGKAFEQRENAMCANHKDFPPPRTMDQLIGNIRAHEKMQALRRRGEEARAKLIGNADGKVPLSEQEKKDCLRDVLRKDAVNNIYKDQTNKFIRAAAKNIPDCGFDQYLTHETLAALPAVGTHFFLQPRYTVRETADDRSVLDTFNDPHMMKAIEKNLDALIEHEVKKGLTLDQMRDKVISSEDKTYEGEALLEAMKEQTDPEPAKEQETEKTLQQKAPERKQATKDNSGQQL